MEFHVGRRLFLAAAVLGAVAVFAMGFFAALGARSVVAGPGSGPAAAPPNPGHSWSEIGDFPGTMWHSNNDGTASGLDADMLDGHQPGSGNGLDADMLDGHQPGSGNGLDADTVDGNQASAFWNIAGNSDTNPPTNFLGTTDNEPLVIKTNDTERVRIEAAGNVGIGTTTPKNKLDAEGGVAIGATYSGTSTAPTNGMIIEGNVGIGTTDPQSALQVDGYVQLALTSGQPPSADCNAAAEQGRMKFDPALDVLWICGSVLGSPAWIAITVA